MTNRLGMLGLGTLGVLLAATLAGAEKKVSICHHPPGNPGNTQTISVSENAVPAHLDHGDTLGACPSGCQDDSSLCDDGNQCTSDTCLPSGLCEHTSVDCNDGNPCTTELCDGATGCLTLPNDGAACDDGSACTAGDVCNHGQCAGTAIRGCCATAAQCDDGDSCTVDTCTSHTCRYSPLNCSVADKCLAGFCDPAAGQCDTTSVSCEDSNVCTDDSCDPAIGCVHVPTSSPPQSQESFCSDGLDNDCDGLIDAADPDCVPALPVCDDNICSPSENCAACPYDCPCGSGTTCIDGTCQTYCGNGTCDGAEDTFSCPIDCQPACGNGLCEAQESCTNCAADCGACPPVCGDGVCTSPENCGTCVGDCQCLVSGTVCNEGSCQTYCGNGTCESGEDTFNCLDDCRPICGNGVCENEETCGTCPGDCGSCSPACGNGACDAGEICQTCPADCGPCGCAFGLADCNGVPADGCETNLAGDVSNCGACENACSAPHAVAACGGGRCQFGCNAPYVDCNGSIALDGCEVNLTNDSNNCGACGNVCPTPPNAVATCGGGACQFSCIAPFADCTPAPGCETNTANNPSSCGACANVCPPGTACVNSSCN